MGIKLESGAPSGPIETRWDRHRFDIKVVNPSNKRKYTVIVVGTGLAGASAAATMGQLGYNVLAFCYQDSARRAHSIAAQGGINAAKNYPNDADSIWRLFYDTVKGGDYRSRESNVYRLAQVSNAIIDQAVAQGVPFARDYGGHLSNRSFGGALVSRTFYAQGATGQQLLLGAYQSLMGSVADGNVKVIPRTEMLDLVVVDGHARGIVTRNLISGKIERWAADAVVLATGGYANVYYLSTNAMGSNVTASWRAAKRGALFANPAYTQIHPTCIPVHGEYQSKLTLMSESLRNDGRVWVPKNKEDAWDEANHRVGKQPNDIPESERDYYLERRYPTFGNLVPRDVASRAAKVVCDDGRGVAYGGRGVYLDFADAIGRLGKQAVVERYGNLFEMYQRITGADPTSVPMRIYPAPHYTMGGLWVDYNLQSNLPGLFIVGEANFSDHGANRLGASALMQGLADGYFVLPYTIGHYLGQVGPRPNDADRAEFEAVEAEVGQRMAKLVSMSGKRSSESFHRDLGKVMIDQVGMARNAEGLKDALQKVRALRAEFWENVSITGDTGTINQSLEKAGRVADFLEFADIKILDALQREESCGGHFREEYKTEEGEARRNDEDFAFVGAWEYTGPEAEPVLHKEHLEFEYVKFSQRSYK